ncbi:MAG: autotransporter [Massilia sp.]
MKKHSVETSDNQRLPRRRVLALLLSSAALSGLSACGGGGSGGGGGASESSPSSAVAAADSATDITAAITQNQDITLTGDSIIRLPAGVTTYSGVISGLGTLTLAAASASASTLVITQASTFTLPPARQVQTVTKVVYPGAGYALNISGSNPPVLTVNAGVTLQIGTNSVADNHPNIIATVDSKNLASVINNEINLNHILNNGTISLNSSQFILLGQISGSGNVLQAPDVWGDNAMGGANNFDGVLSLSVGQNFGSNHVAASLPNAKAILNEGSFLVWGPPGSTVEIKQNIYEASFGGDINFHPIGNSRIVMSGIYSHTDNSPHNSPNLVNPSLSDPSLNLAKVIYRGGANDINGNDGSYRGINIEAGGTVQWGDGTHSRFFLPSAPSPAEVSPALGKKNAYINLHRGGTLAFNYNGPVTLNVGITGGGGGPDRSQSIGAGNVTVMGTPGNDVTFGQPQNYNGVTTIESGAILRLGTGKPVPLNYVTMNATSGKSVFTQASYTGDASLLTVESVGGAASNAISNAGQLIVQNTATNIILSKMSGAGSFVQQGSATTTLRSNSYSGSSTIKTGTVLAGSADAFGTGAVINSANLALAAGQRSLMLASGFTQTASGNLTLAIAGSVAGVDQDSITAVGPVVLDGTLTLNMSGTYAAGQKLVLIRSTAGISGKFSAIVSHGVALTAQTEGQNYVVTLG